MLGVLIALGAQLLIGISLVIDKFFLKTERRGNVIAYTFWIGMLAATGFVVALFGLSTPSLSAVGTAVGAGVATLIALFFYYLALERGEASHTLAIVGGFAPLATVLVASALGFTPLNAAELTAFGFLTFGGLVMFASERVVFPRVIFPVLLASFFFGASNILTKLTFEQTPFATGFVLIKAAEFLTALLILLVPAWRVSIAATHRNTIREHKILYFGNRLLAGAGALLIYGALKLEHPALVEGLNGVRYAIIFICVLLITFIKPEWIKEHFRGWTLAGKIVATSLIMIGLAILGIQKYYASLLVPSPEKISWGVTFSPLMSKHLGVDWKENYEAIVHSLRPAFIRIATYWDTSEPEPGVFNFDDVDWQMQEAEAAHIPIILVVGQKTPRWPECHFPEWVKGQGSRVTQEALLKYLKAAVERYKNHPALLYWQVENEPFLKFGECPPPDMAFLDQEIALVRQVDPVHKILLTDGGEFGDWHRAAKRADIFGHTLYRTVYMDKFNLGRVTYPLTPEWYPMRVDFTRWFLGKPGLPFMDIELGLEPWTKKQIYELPLEEQLELFSMADFKETIAYARDTRYSAHGLWGVEWWYYLKTKYNIPDYWEVAKAVVDSGVRP